MDKVSKLTSDSELWNNFVSGNDDAYKTIYNNHIQSLFKFGLHFTRDEELVQDCIQDLFIDLHKYRSRLKPTNNIKLYLFVSIKRKIIRSCSKEEKYMQLTNQNMLFLFSVTSDEDAENDMRSKRLELLEKAMGELSNRQREAIYLRFVSEMSYEELGEVLQMNYQSARNLIFRGMEKLRESCRQNSLFLMFSFLLKKNLQKKINLVSTKLFCSACTGKYTSMKINTNSEAENLIHHPDFFEWVVRPTEALDQQWNQFLAENPSRKKEVEEAIFLIKNIIPTEMELTDEAVSKLWACIESKTLSGKTKTFRISRWVAAASIFLILGISGAIYYQLTQERNTPVNYQAIAKVEAPDNEVKLIFSDQSEEVLTSKDVAIKYDSTGEILVNADKRLAQKLSNLNNDEEQLNQLVVPRGRRTSLTLSDGTKLWLNSGSRAIYPAVFNKKEREIYIEGEAYLEVAHHASKPFYVVTNQIHVKVLGTKFNVSAYPDDAAASVVLVEGSIQATVNSRKLTMKPNQLLTFEKKTGITDLEETDVLPYTSWKDGWLYCDKEKMGTIATKLSRFYNIKIEFKDIEARELTLTGKLDLKTECADIFKAISSTAPIAYEIQNDAIIISNKIIN